MNSSILSNSQRYAVVILSVMLSLMVVWAAANGATTISANVSTGGTLTVTGASTLSSATLSSTLDVTGATTLTSATMSTTLGVTGLSTFTGGYVSAASSTVSDGNFTVTSSSGKVGIGTTTPATEVSMSGSGTTTVYMNTTSSTKGTCIQMKSADGSFYALSVANGGTGVNLAPGSCK